MPKIRLAEVDHVMAATPLQLVCRLGRASIEPITAIVPVTHVNIAGGMDIRQTTQTTSRIIAKVLADFIYTVHPCPLTGTARNNRD